jgi:sugar phosphate isomerase/epimerase
MKGNRPSNTFSRRKFIGLTTAAAAGVMIGSKSVIGAPAYIRNLGKPNSVFAGIQIGAITYSWRSVPSSAEQVLQYCVDCNVSALELMGNVAESFAGAPAPWQFPASARPANGQRPQLTAEQKAEQAEKAKALAEWRSKTSMEKFEQLKKMYKDAGVSVYAFKPNAFGANNSDVEIDYGMRAARALGATHVTLEMPTDVAQTKRLSDIGAKYKIMVAYHGHEQQTPAMWDAALAESKYNALNCDFGHYTAAGFNAVDLLVAKHERIASAHIKDRQNKEHGGANLVWGTGDTPIVQLLQTMKKNKYKFPATVELEYAIPEGSDAVKETAKCIEYARKALEA